MACIFMHAQRKSPATFLSGSVMQIHDSGPVTLGTATSAAISISGELDEWTFFGRAGETVTVVVDPGSGTVLTPRLNWVQVLVVTTNGTVLATNRNTSAGQVLVLPDIVLPEDGAYRVQVRAHPSYSASTGQLHRDGVGSDARRGRPGAQPASRWPHRNALQR